MVYKREFVLLYNLISGLLTFIRLFILQCSQNYTIWVFVNHQDKLTKYAQILSFPNMMNKNELKTVYLINFTHRMTQQQCMVPEPK